MNSAYALPTEQVLAELHVDPATGLNDNDIAERRRQGGENVLPHAKRRPLARLLLEQFLNIIVLLLAVAAAIAWATGGSGRYWEPQVRKLADDHQIIIVDLLGFGESPWPVNASYDVPEHLDAIHRTVEPIVRGRRATIVGHSMGAILAAEYARRYRDEVSGLIVFNAPMFRSEHEAQSRIKEMSPMAEMFSVQRFGARASCDLVCAFRPLLFRIAARLEQDIPPHVARDAVLHRWESFDRTLRNVVLRSNMEQTLRAVDPLPITILHGADDRITDRDRLEAIAAETGAKLVFIRGDHNMYLRNPDEVVKQIAKALNR